MATGTNTPLKYKIVFFIVRKLGYHLAIYKGYGPKRYILTKVTGSHD